MEPDLSAERLPGAVRLAVDLIRGVDAAPHDNRWSLRVATTTAVAPEADTEAVVLALANIAHALVRTLARQTGTTVDSLLASLAEPPV